MPQAEIEWILDKVYDTTGWVQVKYDAATNNVTEIPGAVIETRTIGGTDVTVIRYSLTDGSQFDEDGLENGVIVDPSGPAVLAVQENNSAISELGETGAAITSGLVLGAGLIVASLFSARRTKVHKIEVTYIP